MARYETNEEEEWFAPTRRGFRWACCDCGLVHKLYFRIADTPSGKQIQMRIAGCSRSTAAMRRKMKKKVVLVHE